MEAGALDAGLGGIVGYLECLEEGDKDWNIERREEGREREVSNEPLSSPSSSISP